MHDYLYIKSDNFFKYSRNDRKSTGITAYFTPEEIERMLELVE